MDSAVRLSASFRPAALTSAPKRSAALVSHSQIKVITTADNAPQLLLYEPKCDA